MSPQPILAKIAVLLCLGVGAFTFMTHSQRTAENKELSAKLARMDSRLASLESSNPVQRLKRSRSRADSPNAPASDTTTTEKDVRQTADNNDATDDLRHQVNEMRRVLAERQLIPPDQASIDSAKSSILDPSTSSVDKMTALRLLRSADARSDDVVRSMIDVYASESDPGIRADIFRQLDGVRTPELKDPLLQAVSEEGVADVREEAAETLAHFLPDDNVREWLEYLRDNDPDDDVREQAMESLARGER